MEWGTKPAPTPDGRFSPRRPGRWTWGTLLSLGLGVASQAADPVPVSLPRPIPAMTGIPVPAVATPRVPVPAPIPIPGVALPPVVVPPEQTAFAQPDPKAVDPKAPGAMPQPQPLPVPGAQPLPAPNPLPFGDDRVRLPRLADGPPVLGATPVPTAQDLEDFRKFVDGVIDPRNTLDLIEGRPRLILLKATPTRTQIGDESIANFRFFEPNPNQPAGQPFQVTVVGRRAGTTVLNLWFADPDAKGKEKVLSYLVRVLPDPELKLRLEAVYRALEIEINKAFPQSRVRLALVGDKLMVSGQAHDVYEATQILRILRANAPGTAGRPPIAAQVPTGNPLDPVRPADTPGLENFQTAGGPLVINNLRVPGEQQIMLKVVVAEVNRAAARSIGLNFNVTNHQGVQVFGQLTGGLGQGGLVGAGGNAGIGGFGGANTGLGGFGAGAAGGLGGGLVNLPINLDNGRFPIALNALRSLSYARSLAEPTLTTMNGQTATFLAGGQFPIPVIGGTGGNGVGLIQGVSFVPFGVQLSFSPSSPTGTGSA